MLYDLRCDLRKDKALKQMDDPIISRESKFGNHAQHMNKPKQASFTRTVSSSMTRYFFSSANSGFSSAHQSEFFGLAWISDNRANTFQISTRFFKVQLTIDATFSIRKGQIKNAVRSVHLEGGLREQAA